MIAALFFVAGFDAVYSVGLRTEFRLRQPTPFDASTENTRAVLDMEVQPQASLLLDTRRVQPSLTYAPRFVLRQLDNYSRPALLQNASLVVPFRISRMTSISLREDVSYGTADYASLSGLAQLAAAGGRLDSVLVGAQVATTSIRTGLQLNSRLARRHAIDVNTYYSHLAGAGDGAQLQTPTQNAVGGNATYAWQMARRVRTGAVADASYTVFAGGPQIPIAQGGASLAYTFATQSELQMTAGASAVHFETWRALPFGRVALNSLRTSRAGRWSIGVSVQLLPFVDRFALAVYERLEVNAGVGLQATPRLGFRLSGQYTMTVLDPVYAGNMLALGDLVMTTKLGPNVTLDTGMRLLYSKVSQAQVTAGTLSTQPVQWLAFVGLGFALSEHI